jgi:ADP-heptose:LPS heptosyltransferase
MQIIEFGADVLRSEAGREFYPGLKYLIHDESAHAIREDMKMTGFELVAVQQDFDEICREKHWRYPQPADSLLVYTTGNIGDHLWTTALVRAIKRRMPEVKIDIASHPGIHAIWSGNKDIRSVRECPVPLDSLRYYDGVIVLDELVANHYELEQPNCYDIIFAHAGIVPDENDVRVPVLRLKHEDEMSAFMTIFTPDEQGRVEITQGHFVIGLHSSSQVRNLHGTQIVELIRSISQMAPGMAIYGLSDNDHGARLQERIVSEHIPSYVPVHRRIGIRPIAALCRTAQCVVSPDTMLVHLAASQNAPCVAIMTTVAPEARTSSYPLCVPIWKQEACKYGVCGYKDSRFHHRVDDVSVMTPCYTPQRFMCDVAQAVTTKDILLAMSTAIRAKHAFDGFEFPELPL